MANLKEIAELVWRQHNPNPTAQTVPKLAEYIQTAKVEYSYQLWRISKEQKRTDGEWEVPSSLLRQGQLEIVDNEADTSELKMFRSFDNDLWIANIGGFDCECKYQKRTVNLNNILCDDDYLGNSKPYIPIGSKILFPKGTHAKSISIIYASNGTDVDDSIEIDDAIAGLLRRSLHEVYLKKYSEDNAQNIKDPNPQT